MTRACSSTWSASSDRKSPSAQALSKQGETSEANGPYGETTMSQERTWTCDGCGHEHALRKIDAHRWVNQTANESGACRDKDTLLQLCPSCQARRLQKRDPNSQGGEN